MIAILLLGCVQNNIQTIHFDGPVDAAVLDSEESPFSEVVGFVANSRNGTIVALDLKEGRILTDDDGASFLRASPLATGNARILSEIEVTALDGTITLWAADTANRAFLRVPYVVGVDSAGNPLEVEPTASEVSFVDGDDSGDQVTLGELEVRAGFTTTETWSIEHDGTRWWAKGSRSGVQEREPLAGVAYHSDRGEVAFLIDGTATEGDRFAFTTDTGIEEWTLDGVVTGMAQLEGYVLVSVASEPGALHAFDASTGDWTGGWWFDEGVAPGRIAMGEGGRLWIGDTALPQVHQLDLTISEAGITGTATTIPTAGVVIDVAHQSGEDAVGEPFDRLFVAPMALQRVDIWDLETESWFDPNPLTAVVEGIPLGSPVLALAPSVGSVWSLQDTAWGATPRVPMVAIATGDGFLFSLDASTGCLAEDYRGAYGPNATWDSSSSYTSLLDQGPISDSFLWIDEATGEQIVTSACGGVTRTETWTVTYEGATLDWVVDGSLSGRQTLRAREDERYVSDTGAISFLIAPGLEPATTGDHFLFGTDGGLLTFRGSDLDEDGAPETPWEFPGRPVGFQTFNGPTGGGWDPVDRREFMLVPVVNADVVGRAHLDSGKTEIRWQ